MQADEPKTEQPSIGTLLLRAISGDGRRRETKEARKAASAEIDRRTEGLLTETTLNLLDGLSAGRV